MGGFPGAEQLTNQLSPVSLQQRKQQLINQMVTGRKSRSIVGGSGMPIAPGLGSNPLLAGLFQSGYGHNPGGQFYGAPGGAPVGPTQGPLPGSGDPSNPAVGASPSPTNFTPAPITAGGHDPLTGVDSGALQTLLAQMFAGGGGRLFAS